MRNRTDDLIDFSIAVSSALLVCMLAMIALSIVK